MSGRLDIGFRNGDLINSKINNIFSRFNLYLSSYTCILAIDPLDNVLDQYDYWKGIRYSDIKVQVYILVTNVSTMLITWIIYRGTHFADMNMTIVNMTFNIQPIKRGITYLSYLVYNRILLSAVCLNVGYVENKMPAAVYYPAANITWLIRKFVFMLCLSVVNKLLCVLYYAAANIAWVIRNFVSTRRLRRRKTEEVLSIH